MVRSFRQPSNPPWRLPQRSRPAGVHRNVSESLEQKSQTLRVDRDRRIHSGKAHSLSPDFGADPARLHQPQVQKKEEAMTAYLFSRHHTRSYSHEVGYQWQRIENTSTGGKATQEGLGLGLFA